MPVFANILQPLIDVFGAVLVFFHDTFGFSWGWSIVAMTVVVRAALLPLAIRQYKSMKALQRFSPQIKELQQKYKDDRQRLNQEMMRFYQENKVNPFGACLPLLFQLPVFISLFYMLRMDLRYDICPEINAPNGVELTGNGFPKACGSIPDASFLGIPDITSKAGGATLVILILLYVGTQVVSTLVMSQPTMDRNQRLIMLALPVIFVPFIIGFPAGLLVYWITTNVWTLLQQFTIRETLGRRWDRQWEAEAALAAAGGARAPSQPTGFCGRWAGRGAAAQEQQQQAAGGGRGGARGTAAPAESGGRAESRPRSSPPPSRRKKKKRSGRRR
ncbi:MAG: membrane protein insertase YidC [Solirubrobacteraceae bacterium]|nr:membrane protein insertase YidC [Solirubrobacteraceae bacterium]